MSHWTEILEALQRPEETEAEWTARTGGAASISDPFAAFRDQEEASQ